MGAADAKRLRQIELNLEAGAVAIQRQRLLLMRQILSGQIQNETENTLEQLLTLQRLTEAHYQSALSEADDAERAPLAAG
jgi:hypothetical protein